jgi:glycosyltransferase involved in cell wall biosynthesis
MVRVVICGTHPNQFNGYSKVVYELSKYLELYDDIELFIFGFQNFYDHSEHANERKLKKTVIYDVYKNEEPKSKGFGENLIKDYLLDVKPDIVIVYNDLMVLNSLLSKIHEIPDRKFRIIPYVDLVYKNERNILIKILDEKSDGAIMFCSYWNDVIKQQGYTKPTYIVEHGFDRMSYYPMETQLARKYFGLPESCFIFMNLNRNQPRKRWDICLMAFIKFISLNRDCDAKLLIATPLKGSWDLIDIMTSECNKYSMTLMDLQKHLLVIQNPQKLTDFDINVLYNACDVGLNTCDGEGFGLCNFEHGGIGKPQIVPFIGGFRDFITKKNSYIVKPKYTFYRDHTTDVVSGEAEVCDINDYVDAMQYYYDNQDIAQIHGKRFRENIINNYTWKSKSEQLYNVIINETKDIIQAKELAKQMEQKSKNEILNVNELEQLEVISGNYTKPSQTSVDLPNIDVDGMSVEDMKKVLKQFINKASETK